MILFVDDEKKRLSTYVEELELENYTVSFQTKVDDALKFLRENRANIELLIMDIMMPPGESFKNSETNGGARTGVFLYEEVRKEFSDLPVIVLTNVSDQEISDKFHQENGCKFLRKEAVFPYQLVEEIKDSLEPKN